MDPSVFLTADAWISLATLAALEIVLGIDNIVFITILTNKLPESQRKSGRTVGLALALVSRLGLLFAISWVMGLTKPLFDAFDHAFSGRDLILMVGGLFLVGKATHEIFHKTEVETPDDAKHGAAKPPSYGWVLAQITVLDIVFSLDSVITAVGMANHLIIMVVAMLIAVAVMLLFAGPVGDFVNRHPSMQILALSFLILIGVMLLVEGWGTHVNKGYIYFAMGFSLVVDLIQMRVLRSRSAPVELHSPASRAAAKPAPEAEG